MRKIIFFVVLFIMPFFTTIASSKDRNLDLRDFDVDLTDINKIMIVAHPDDEMIWGGSHLIDDNYLVVCITCGADNRRVEEFKNVMRATNDKYIMLNYPDKTNGERDNWDMVYDDISFDIERILSFKNWEEIVTHNKKGEYGHIHHKMTNAIVTEIYEKNYKGSNNLYFFGKYYKADKIDDVKDDLEEISDENYNKKNNIIYKYYVSQRSVADGLNHMFKYENWTKYE